jgi:aspartyl-tRNA(Asn)/glutamyl-tRNA(Gln) amidotransferase subunit C
MIEKKDVQKLAFLSRIKLSEEELNSVPGDVQSVLQYIQKLNDANTEGVEPLFHFQELKNVVREDNPEIIERDLQKKMIAMGKDKDDYLKVESIL